MIFGDKMTIMFLEALMNIQMPGGRVRFFYAHNTNAM